MREIIFAGFGGQGVLTSGLITSQIAVFKGQNATWMPSYGSAMRGGTANCTVRYGFGPIYNPSLEEPDLLLAMNMPSFQAFIGMVKPGGKVLVNSDLVLLDEAAQKMRSDVTYHSLGCNSLAQEIGQPRGANVIMTGAVTKLLEDFTLEEGLQGMNDMFRKKGKSKFEQNNIAAFQRGYTAL